MGLDFSFVGNSVNTTRAMPAAFFKDPEVFQAEVERVFRSDWISVARSEQIPAPGDYLTFDFFGDPIIVVRDKTGRVNAFSNVCLHRACPIAEGDGNAKNLFVCPYHKWTYDLTGKMRGAPDMEQAEDFDRNRSLPPLAVEEWQGWIFVNNSKDPSPLAESLSELDALLSDWNVAELKSAGVLEFDSHFNWKVLVENFMESYHHMGPHAESLEPVFPHNGTHPVETQGHYTLLENPSIDATAAAPFWVGLIYPSTMFALVRTPGAPVLGWYQVFPDSVDRFKLKIHVLTTQEVIDAGHGNAAVESFNAIHNEDIPICEKVWRGLQSRLYEPGRLSHLEGCIHDFHVYLKSRLSD